MSAEENREGNFAVFLFVIRKRRSGLRPPLCRTNRFAINRKKTAQQLTRRRIYRTGYGRQAVNRQRRIEKHALFKSDIQNKGFRSTHRTLFDRTDESIKTNGSVFRFILYPKRYLFPFRTNPIFQSPFFSSDAHFLFRNVKKTLDFDIVFTYFRHTFATIQSNLSLLLQLRYK